MTTSRLLAIAVLLFSAATGDAESNPGARTACQILPAPQASRIVGKAVTAHLMTTPSAPAGVCLYSAGAPVFQFGISKMQTPGVAAANLKFYQSRKNVAARQKGDVILSLITMNGDTSKFNALLEAAADNL